MYLSSIKGIAMFPSRMMDTFALRQPCYHGSCNDVGESRRNRHFEPDANTHRRQRIAVLSFQSHSVVVLSATGATGSHIASDAIKMACNRINGLKITRI